jgi:hypothetical protein
MIRMHGGATLARPTGTLARQPILVQLGLNVVRAIGDLTLV